MSELVRTVRSGIVGLDLALGGGFRFLRRSHAGDRESAIVLVRGGPGVGKSVLAGDLALRLAAAAEGDVLYFCYEVLPSEVRAQRMGFDGYDASRVVDLSEKGRRDPSVEGTVLVLGMVDAPLDDDDVPDIGRSLLDLSRIATARGHAPKVVVVDSLSEGYGLGTSVPRPVVDGLCKLAVEQGWVLILVEETVGDAPSPWTFAVDTVLSLRLSAVEGEAQSRRELLVTKHRFGSCEPGPHGLLIERERVRVIPPFAAYRNAVRDLALPPPATGVTLAIPAAGEVTFPAWFDVEDGEGRVVVVKGSDAAFLKRLSSKIGRTSIAGAARGVVFSFLLVESQYQPLMRDADERSVGTLHPFVRGDEWLEEALFRLSAEDDRNTLGVSHVLVGPTDVLLRYEHCVDLRRAVSLFASLVSARGLIAVVFGKEPFESIRAAIVTDEWSVDRETKGLPVITALGSRHGEPFTFTPALD